MPLGRLLRRVDWVLVLTVVVIMALGLTMIAGSTAEGWRTVMDSSYVRRQGIFALLGLGAMFLSLSVDYRYLRSLSRFFYVVSLGLLGAVLGYGVTAGGATRWLLIGPLRFQPTEVVRIMVILTLANQVTAPSRSRSDEYTWADFGWSVLHVGLPALLVLAQPDLGSALVFGAVLLGELYLGGFNPWRLLAVAAAAGAGVCGTLVAYLRYDVEIPFLKPYMVNRLVAFVDPTADPTGAGYHLQQSIIAIGSGRLTGNGLFRGAGAQLHFLPEQHTDFIFSALGEQVGFAGVALLLLAFTVMFLRMLSAAAGAGAGDRYGAVLVGGVVAMLLFRVVVNVGMTVGIMPITGLPLPFVSYGGTALVADLICVGLVLNVGMRRHRIRF
ncbi:MAG: rod shape-determining protein RodA [Bacillota bacterium]